MPPRGLCFFLALVPRVRSGERVAELGELCGDFAAEESDGGDRDYRDERDEDPVLCEGGSLLTFQKSAGFADQERHLHLEEKMFRTFWLRLESISYKGVAHFSVQKL